MIKIQLFYNFLINYVVIETYSIFRCADLIAIKFQKY